MTSKDMKDITISVLVNNHFGVLTKVAGMFSRRGVNIKALSVGETENPRFSRLTIHAKGNAAKLEQVCSQMHKLEDVNQVKVLEPQNSNSLGIILAKLKPGDKLADLSGISPNACVEDIGNGCVLLKAHGNLAELNALVNKLKNFGLIELATSGQVALDTSPNPLGA